jgi:hypothetical protein
MNKAPARSPHRLCEQLIERLYSSNEPGIAEFVSALPQEERVNVAVLCYGRVHLRDIALEIAATCDRAALIEAAGKIMGDILFTQSRQPTPLPVLRSSYRKATITLASIASAGALSHSVRRNIAEPEDGQEETSEADKQDTIDDAEN